MLGTGAQVHLQPIQWVVEQHGVPRHFGKWRMHGAACRQLVMCLGLSVRQEKKPFAEGGMRFCVRMYELDDNGDFMPVTALPPW